MPEPIIVQGEVLPPLSQFSPASSVSVSNESLNYIATLLDDKFTVPGTRIRFGLDALIGWIPGLGDAVAAIASLFIVFAAWRRGAARVTLLRMVLNLAVEDTLGAIPIIGDLAHVAWKANRRNYNLLIRDQQSARRRTWQDWLFVIAVVLIMIVLFLSPFILLMYLFKSHRPY